MDTILGPSLIYLSQSGVPLEGVNFGSIPTIKIKEK